MFAVIFEVEPKPGNWDDYLAIAATLKPELERIDGFLANERFRSREREGLLLSFSTWRDEKALVRWRSHALHHQAQVRGRQQVFADYHLRVGEIVADTDADVGQQDRPARRTDETETGIGKAVTLTEATPKSDTPVTADELARLLGLAGPGCSAGLVDAASFESIVNPGKLLWLATWRETEAAASWWAATGAPGVRQLADRAHLRHRGVPIVRDYGLFDRREAPQYHAPVAQSGSEG
ncbi:MAG: antibiotic biosynthesis monooxygenase family protein [Pseudomonadota bacterium]